MSFDARRFAAAFLATVAVAVAAPSRDGGKIVSIVWSTACAGCTAEEPTLWEGEIPSGVTITLINLVRSHGTCVATTPPTEPACASTKACKFTLRMNIAVAASFSGYVGYYGSIPIDFFPGHQATFTDVLNVECGSWDGVDITWYSSAQQILGTLRSWTMTCTACSEIFG